MKFVELYRLENDGSQTVVLRCRLEGETVVFDRSSSLGTYLEKEGIKNRENPEALFLFPKDGLRFLEQLSYNFSSGYLNASEVKEE